jgi:uncharacterized protein (DUF1330 family)
MPAIRRSPRVLSTPGIVMLSPSRFTLTMLVSLQPGGGAALAAFRQASGPLLARHDVRIERVIRIHGKGQIVGSNDFEQPDLIQQISLPSAEAFKAYVADPEYQALAPARDAGIRRMTACAGPALDVSAIATPGQGEVAARLYGVGLVRFKTAGEAGLDAFNRQAQPLFARHGMHVESMQQVMQVMTPVGTSEGLAPQRVVVFFLDDAARLPAYAADPEYRHLAPLRDDGLVRYDFFLGTVPQA